MSIKTSSFGLFLLSLLSTLVTAQCPASLTTPPCLNSGESYNLALRWLQIFQTDNAGKGTGSALIDSTLMPNFTYYDEGASFGSGKPVYDSSHAVYKSVTGSGYSGTLVTDVQYSILTAFASCDIVVCRWKSASKSAKAKGVTVPVGTPVTYEGTDYLQIDLVSRLIYNVTSSSDLLNYYIALGDDIIKRKSS